MKSGHPESRTRDRDLILYLAISFLVVLVLLGLGLSDLSLRSANQLFSFGFFTAILYGAFLFLNRPIHRKRAFWALTVITLLFHLVLFIALMTQISNWRPIWNVAMFFEAPVLDYLKGRFVSKRRKNARAESGRIDTE